MYSILTAILIFGFFPSSGSGKMILDLYFSGAQPERQVKLARKIQEISGLATSSDGRLFAHDDEKAVISQLDPENGQILKQFFIGSKKPVEEDFEGLAIVGPDFYLVTSNGKLYQFTEGNDRESVKYKDYKTGLTAKYDVEGLCYDPETKSLLLACKGFAGKGLDNMRSVFSFSLERMKLDKKPRFKISIDDITRRIPTNISRKMGEFFLLIDPPGFAPSGIERHPVSGSFFILSSRSGLIAEIDTEGNLIAVRNLDTNFHRQPEGITFLPDHTMVIGDEGDEQKATLTFYSFQK